MDDGLNALLIVDQIHKFAVTTHRDFVLKHLEPWLQLAEEELGSVCDNVKCCTPDDIASPLFRAHMLNSGYYKSSSMPLWEELEIAARVAQSAKRNESRQTESNKRRRKAEGDIHLEDDPMEEC